MWFAFSMCLVTSLPYVIKWSECHFELSPLTKEANLPNNSGDSLSQSEGQTVMSSQNRAYHITTFCTICCVFLSGSICLASVTQAADWRWMLLGFTDKWINLSECVFQHSWPHSLLCYKTSHSLETCLICSKLHTNRVVCLLFQRTFLWQTNPQLYLKYLDLISL